MRLCSNFEPFLPPLSGRGLDGIGVDCATSGADVEAAVCKYPSAFEVLNHTFALGIENVPHRSLHF